MEKQETITKSVDALIEEFFTEEVETTEEPIIKAKKDITSEIVEKEVDDGASEQPGPKETKADQVKAPKAKKDDSEGRPEEVSDVPDEDEDGKRAKGYESIQRPNKEVPQSNEKGTIVKSEDKIEITKEEFELLKKAKEAQQEEILQKAKAEQNDLIKSAIAEAMESTKAENEELKKSLKETQDLIKAMARKPQAAKAVTSVAALEKSFGGDFEAPKAKNFTKGEVLDAAEALCKSGEITVEQVIELEDSGTLLDSRARSTIERYLKRKG